MAISDATTVPTLLTETAALGTHPAVVDGDVVISYAELLDQVRAVARSYLAQGVEPGDRIGLWAPNRHEFILAMLGAQFVGIAVVPLNTRYTGHEAAEILARSRATALIVSDGFLGKSFSASLRQACAEREGGGDVIPGLPHLRTVVALEGGGEGGQGITSWKHFLASGSMVNNERVTIAAAAVTPDSIMDVLFTSGTTGIPKGVLTAHRQTLSVSRTWALGAELTPEDRYAIVNPFFHGFGYKAGMISSLMAGATIYPLAVLDTDVLLDLIQSARISVLPGVPTIFTSLLDHPRLGEYDLSSLRFSIAGATAAPATLFHDMVNTLGFTTVAQAYGLTECVVATLSRHGESLEHASRTTGPAVEGMEIRVVDENGEDVGEDVDGEILLRGDNVMLGYFEDQEATDAVIDADGWFHTGDVGQLDEHGCLKITDRLKDMFIVGGFNVYPAEVENVLRKHPAVNESAVIGIEDARMGTVGRAYVLLLHNADPRPDATELEAFCRIHLANFKVPREFVFVENFPRNAPGKILKSELRAQV